ncbi:MAG: exodeoxyribonuclease VII large subunit [Candidatus Paceibacterota bacterium]|nr:MAG: exodeoxyribonuclease VII large subunit [Candidatus Paceibacterota bacterium]
MTASNRVTKAAEEALMVSVSAFLDGVNAVLAEAPALVFGETTGVHHHPSGLYFSLKDPEDGSLLDCYMNPYAARMMASTLEDGMRVKVAGNASIYKPKGRFSLRVEYLEPLGEGSLQRAYLLLKEQLEREGLFARKRPLPQRISRIGIITSRTGAVIDDFRKNLPQRGMSLSLYSVRVEGARAPEEIIHACAWMQDHADDFDVIAVMRGGGSLEDLQAFNTEGVVRAIHSLSIPVICAIGHDRDVPLACLAADVATSTPTAAAMAVAQSWEPFVVSVERLREQLIRATDTALHRARALVDAAPLLAHVRTALARSHDRVASLALLLESADPQRVLERGYSVVTRVPHGVVRTTRDVAPGDKVRIRMRDGSRDAKIES